MYRDVLNIWIGHWTAQESRIPFVIWKEQLEPRNCKVGLNIFTKFKFETVQRVICFIVGHNVFFLYICMFFSPGAPFRTGETSWSVKWWQIVDFRTVHAKYFKMFLTGVPLWNFWNWNILQVCTILWVLACYPFSLQFMKKFSNSK